MNETGTGAVADLWAGPTAGRRLPHNSADCFLSVLLTQPEGPATCERTYEASLHHTVSEAEQLAAYMEKADLLCAHARTNADKDMGNQQSMLLRSSDMAIWLTDVLYTQSLDFVDLTSESNATEPLGPGKATSHCTSVDYVNPPYGPDQATEHVLHNLQTCQWHAW